MDHVFSLRVKNQQVKFLWVVTPFFTRKSSRLITNCWFIKSQTSKEVQSSISIPVFCCFLAMNWMMMNMRDLWTWSNPLKYVVIQKYNIFPISSAIYLWVLLFWTVVFNHNTFSSNSHEHKCYAYNFLIYHVGLCLSVSLDFLACFYFFREMTVKN